MVDGVLLLVDAAEGPLPQTRFVLSKALERGLPPLVVINKIDRPDARSKEVLNEVYDLFIDLDATEEQIEFPVLYTSGRAGTASTDLDEPGDDLRPLFDAILNHVPPPVGDPDAAAADAGRQPRLQRLPRPPRHRPHLPRPGQGRRPDRRAQGRRPALLTKVTKLFAFDGLKRVEVDEAPAGDIVAWPASRTSASARRSPPEHRHPSRRCGRRAHAVDDLRRQHLALRGQRRPVRDLAAPARAAGEGAARQRVAARRAHRAAGTPQGAGPRRAAAGHPDRDHAARGLRAAGLEPRGHHRRWRA